MSRRLRIAVVFGGRSGEHEVSLMSAASVMAALNRNKYDIVPIGITKDGRWLIGDDPLAALQEGDMSHVAELAVVAGPNGKRLVQLGDDHRVVDAGPAVDLYFPVLHGTYGEDGCIQGLFELMGVPYVGSGVAASAVGMDKVLMKSAFAAAGLPQLPYTVVHRSRWEADPEAVMDEVERAIGYACFVKPANLGSSVGISKARDRASLAKALAEAARYDRKLVVEQAAENCREIEVSVLGNEDPMASVPGEIVPANDFYDYEAKYIDNRSQLHIPAALPDPLLTHVMRLAVQAFLAIDGAGLSRVDFFVSKDGSDVYVNEVNTMPGFTHISMYPKLWEASGLPYSQLLDRLIELALERHDDNARSQRVYVRD